MAIDLDTFLVAPYNVVDNLSHADNRRWRECRRRLFGDVAALKRSALYGVP